MLCAKPPGEDRTVEYDLLPRWKLAVNGITIALSKGRIFEETMPLLAAAGIEPVSYTHLDVYKRQLYGLALALFGYFVHHSFALAQVVGFTIVGNMTGAALLAVMLPMIFHRLKVDPAIATGPFVTTAVDVLGVLNYFAIATMVYHFE